MKTSWRYKLLYAVLILALLAQCTPVAFAADMTPEIWYLEGGVPDEDGAMIPEYWVDAYGNRMKETPQKRMRASATLPRSYDLRDFGLVTPVKKQAGAESCWAFGAVASLESNYIRQGFGTLENTDFSEAHLVWFGQRQRTPDTTDPTYGDGLEIDNPFKIGSHWQAVSSTLLRGSGLQLEQNAPWISSYDDSQLMQMAQSESDRYVSYARLWSAEKVADKSPQTIKQMIMQNGAATLSYYDDYSSYQSGKVSITGYSPDRTSYYQTAKTNTTNHTVSVVGWDDDYPRAKFNDGRQPSSDGAWLIKGSYGSIWGDGGYYWISYEEPSLDSFVSFVAAPADVYDHIYQYDGSFSKIQFGVPGSGKMANVFTAERDELLTHVVFFSPNTTPVKATAEIYVAPDSFQYSGTNPVSGMTKISDATTVVTGVGCGYYTVELDAPVLLQQGRMFTVVVTMEQSGTAKVQIPAEGYTVDNPASGVTTYSGSPGESFIGYNGSWYDTNAYPGGADYNNVPIKAMTREVSAEEPSLTLLKQPDKTTYTVGETLDTTGLCLLYTDENGSRSVLVYGASPDLSAFNEPGTQTAIVTYGGLSASFDVKVIVNEPTLSLVTAPDTTTYMVGDTIDTTGLSLLYTDEYGVQSTVTDGFYYTPHTLCSIGTKPVNVIYNDLSVSFDVTSEAYETSMTLQSAPNKTAYYINETINTNGLKLQYTDEFNKTRVITSGFECSPKTFSSDGTQTVTATYRDRCVTFDVTVEMYEPTLTLVYEPDKTVYYIDETLDTTGLTLVYMNEFGDEMTVTASYSCDPQAFSEFGKQTVTVTYNDLEVQFDVTVEPYEPTLTLQTAPDKTEYFVGEALDTTGLELLYTDEYGDALVVTDGYVCDPQTFQTEGTQSVTATYNDLSVTFDVTVSSAGLFLVSDASARAGETVDVAVRIQRNPGIVSAWLELDYDTDVLELTGVRNGGIFSDACFTPAGDLTATPFRVLFIDALSETNYTQDGELVVFTFRVRTDAPADATTLRLTHRANSTVDVSLQNVPFETQDGTFTVNRLPGDVNADGCVDMKDVVMLRRYLANWGVTINLSNADVDMEADVDVRDVVYITRFLAGGYGLTLH